MADTEAILRKARELGELIAQHETVARFDAAVKALREDTEAQRAVTDLNRHLEKLSQKQAENKPIEVEDKRRLESLQTAVVRNAVLRDFQTAQMDYVDLLRRVDEAVMSAGDIEPPEPGGVAGPAVSAPVNPDLSHLRGR